MKSWKKAQKQMIETKTVIKVKLQLTKLTKRFVTSFYKVSAINWPENYPKEMTKLRKTKMFFDNKYYNNLYETKNFNRRRCIKLQTPRNQIGLFVNETTSRDYKKNKKYDNTL